MAPCGISAKIRGQRRERGGSKEKAAVYTGISCQGALIFSTFHILLINGKIKGGGEVRQGGYPSPPPPPKMYKTLYKRWILAETVTEREGGREKEDRRGLTMLASIHPKLHISSE